MQDFVHQPYEFTLSSWTDAIINNGKGSRAAIAAQKAQCTVIAKTDPPHHHENHRHHHHQHHLKANILKLQAAVGVQKLSDHCSSAQPEVQNWASTYPK